MSHLIKHFSPLSLVDTKYRRDIRVPEAYRPEGYADDYDDTTLWYDLIWSDGVLTAVCPKLHNLEQVFPILHLNPMDGVAKLSRIKRYRRHDIVEIECAEAPTHVQASIAQHSWDAKVSMAEPDLFRGLNVHIAVSKDNDLAWLRDHARFHQHHHGLDGVILIDNKSSQYDPEDISAVYRDIGLKASLVISAPFKYGPFGRRPYARRTKFMQTALLNALRLRYLSAARAVLQCDIDELVISRNGQSVFDLAAASFWGCVRFRGAWYVPSNETDLPVRHLDHDHIHHIPKPCPAKYCIVPNGRLRRFSWDMHALEKCPVNPFTVRRDIRYMHCREISTFWKPDERRQRPTESDLDPLAKVALAEAFRRG